jgi:hypothetical protein
MKKLIVSIVVVLIGLSSLVVAQSLTTGAITGSVMDQSGAVIVGVIITATNVNTGATRRAETSAGGSYVIAQLDPGEYKVTAESNGFMKTEFGPITVAVSRIASVNFSLKVGSSKNVVVVNQEAPLIEPSNPNTTTTFNATQLADIPNPGNDLSYVAPD